MVMPHKNSVITTWKQNLSWSYNNPGEAYLDPYYDSYAPLVENMLKMGYELNKTFFPTTYDWRNSNVQSAAYLHSVLTGVVQDRAEDISYVHQEEGELIKANLLVHSMGGLVARTYISGLAAQTDTPYDPNVQRIAYPGTVNKLVFLATPHRGFPATYNTYEGLTWYEYLSSEYAGNYNDGSWTTPDTILRRLMDNVLWPFFILHKYQPAYYEDGSFQLCGMVLGASLENLNTCSSATLYAYSHHPTRGILSLPEMLPPVGDFTEAVSREIPAYLSETGTDLPYPYQNGNEFASPNGYMINPLLEGLGLNSPATVSTFANNLGIDNIYVVYGTNKQTALRYIVKPAEGWDGLGWQNGEPVNNSLFRPEAYPDTTDEGDNLIPTYSTRLLDDGNGLLPNLNINHEIRVFGDPNLDYGDMAGHKAIAYSPEAQQTVAWAFAGVTEEGKKLPFITKNYPPIFFLNNGDVVVSLLFVGPHYYLVDDGQGHQIGNDEQGEPVNTFPDAYHSGYDQKGQIFLLPANQDSTYTVQIAGTETGPYQATIIRVTNSETELLENFEGVIQTGVTGTIGFTYTWDLPIMFEDDMEQGGNNWATTGSWSLDTVESHTPSYAWLGSVTNEEMSLTLLPQLEVDQAQTLYLQWWGWVTSTTPLLSTDSFTATVEASTDNGTNWQTVWQTSNTQYGWMPLVADLSRFAGYNQPDLQLRFTLSSEGQTVNWYVDDVTIYYRPLHPDIYQLPWADELDEPIHWIPAGSWSVYTTTTYIGDQSWFTNEDGATLTLQAPVDLTNTTNPVLTFGTQWTAPLTSTGWLEVSLDEQTWTPIYTQTTPITTWTPIEVPLTDYIDQTIYLRFRLEASGMGQAEQGWWIDGLFIADVPVQIIHNIPLYDGMENSTNWHNLYGWEVNDNIVYSGTGSLRATTNQATLKFEDKVDLTTAITPTLTFWQKADWPVPAQGVVLVSIDGFEWQTVYTTTTNTTTWEQVTVDLSAFAGETIEIVYVVQVTGSVPVGNYGWYIDEWSIID